MAEYLKSLPPGRTMSHLALLVAAGTLESVADATPNRLGHTYLRATHALIHPEGEEAGKATYYTRTTVPETVKREMSMWLTLLDNPKGCWSRGPRTGTLLPTWGDGSGTGTGGMICLSEKSLKMWMGQWSPTVYKQSSNWKELKTLLLTLQQLALEDQGEVDGTTVFYFTDNSPTYWIAASQSSTSPGLHALLESITLLTIKLGCFLQVVHVPGVIMIDQGTDGLSRGIWAASPLHDPMDPDGINRAVFDPLTPNRDLVEFYVHAHQLPLPWALHQWDQCWGRDLFDHLSVWFLPPKIARQVLIGILEAWVERPTTTSALLFVPRTLSDAWRGLSRHLLGIDEIRPDKTALSFPPRLSIPIAVLYLTPHVRSLPITRGLDLSPLPRGFLRHQREADEMRRMHEKLPPKG